ncbi:hypothetical protein IWZ03DRAFT_385053, partial [Phyllosticta citriasiana]
MMMMMMMMMIMLPQLILLQSILVLLLQMLGWLPQSMVPYTVRVQFLTSRFHLKRLQRTRLLFLNLFKPQSPAVMPPLPLPRILASALLPLLLHQ